MTPRLVFFDVGGTLVTAPSFADMLRACLADLGAVVDEERLSEAVRRWRLRLEEESSAREGSPSREGDRAWWRGAAEGVLEACGLDETLRREGGRLFVARNGAAESLRVYADVEPCLARLRARSVPMGILSNWSWDLPETLDGLGWGGVFDPVVVSSRVGWRKPHRRIFEHAAALVGLPPSDLLLVGDRLDADVEAALAAGWQAILVDRTGRHPSADVPCSIISALEDLPELLEA